MASRPVASTVRERLLGPLGRGPHDLPCRARVITITLTAWATTSWSSRPSGAVPPRRRSGTVLGRAGCCARPRRDARLPPRGASGPRRPRPMTGRARRTAGRVIGTARLLDEEAGRHQAATSTRERRSRPIAGLFAGRSLANATVATWTHGPGVSTLVPTAITATATRTANGRRRRATSRTIISATAGGNRSRSSAATTSAKASRATRPARTSRAGRARGRSKRRRSSGEVTTALEAASPAPHRRRSEAPHPSAEAGRGSSRSTTRIRSRGRRQQRGRR